MTEQLHSDYEHEGTRFDAETEVYVHAGNPDLIDLEPARVMRRQAEAAVAQARIDAERAATELPSKAHTTGARVTYYRREELGLAA